MSTFATPLSDFVRVAENRMSFASAKLMDFHHACRLALDVLRWQELYDRQLTAKEKRP